MPAPVIAAVLSGLIADTVFDIATQLVSFDEASADRRAFIRGERTPDAALVQAIDAAVARMTEVPAIAQDLGGEQLRSFLRSPEARALVGQIFVTEISDTPGTSIGAVRTHFVSLLVNWTGLSDPIPEANWFRIFDALVSAIREALGAAISRNVLGAHEANSALRQVLLSDQLNNIARNVEALASPRATLAEILTFEHTYRRQVAAREGYIVPPSLDRNDKRPINTLYVTPHLFPPDESGRPATDTIGYDDFLQLLNRAVLLGDPGAGKSTLTLKLCHDLATLYDSRPLRATSVTPILVVLRDYGAAKKDSPTSVLQFIETVACTRYQLPGVPTGAFDYMLRNGRAVVIFDGLDELLDTSYRLDISSDVEAFSTLYPATPVLVTSRRIGYEQAPLDAKRFVTFRLAEFDDEQVLDYATNWFGLDLTLARQQVRDLVTAFMVDSRSITDLRSNPLLLGLLCNIYRGEHYIPANRPAVYEKCAVMLFERWDRGRGIAVALPFEARLRPTMQHLAHWIYSDQKLQAGVTRAQLVDEASDYLLGRQYDDPDEARSGAGEFIDLCKGRAWVFTDTGSTAQGEPLFQFTHRTFLEYFCGDYLARTRGSPKALAMDLLGHIAQREWDVVAQLAIHIKTRYAEDAADEVLDTLLAGAATMSDDQGMNVLDFAARTLEFLVPSPRCVRAVVATCVHRLAATAAVAWPRDRSVFENSMLHQQADPSGLVVRALCSSGREVRGAVLSGLERELVTAIEGRTPAEACVAVEIAAHLDLAGGTRYGTPSSDDEFRTVCEVGERVLTHCAVRLQQLGCDDVLAGMDLVVFGVISVRDFVEAHGIGALFSSRPVRLFGSMWLLPVAMYALTRASEQPGDATSGPRREACRSLVRDFETTALETAPPWRVPPSRMQQGIWLVHCHQMTRRDGGEHQFGIFVNFAVMYELATPEERAEFHAPRRSPVEAASEWLVLCAVMRDTGELGGLSGALEGITDGAQRAFVTRWVSGEATLVAQGETDTCDGVMATGTE